MNDFDTVIREDEPNNSKAHQLFAWLTGMDGHFAYGASGVMVLNDEMEITQAIRNVHLPEEVKMARLDEPIIMNEVNGLFGIYHLRTGTCLVKPEYMSMSQKEDGPYIGYQDVGDKTVCVWSGWKPITSFAGQPISLHTEP